MDYHEMLSHLQYEDVIEKAIQRKRKKDYPVIKRIAEEAYWGADFHFPLCNYQPLTRLTVLTYLLSQKYTEYKRLGISDDVIFETFRDVSLRAAFFYRKTGKVGLSKDDVIWFRHIMNVNLFKIGVLQFQPFQMIYLDKETIGEDYMQFPKTVKEELPSGVPVINCHIQRNSDICPDLVEEAFEKAKQFFAEHFPTVNYQAFLCYSWLLYPPMIEKLPEYSKIRKFAEQFEIIGQCSDSEQAMENLFEDRKTKISKSTFLQRIALEDKENLGFGCGIIRI